MAVDRRRVSMVFATGPAGETFGSGYAVSEQLILTAAHVISRAGLSVNDRVEVCVLGSESWVTSTVSWLDTDLDVALLRVDSAAPLPTTGMSVLRWGRLAGAEPAFAAAMGFPWSQQRPDGVRDTEHVVGFVPPGTGAQTGTLQLSVVSSTPVLQPAGSSPWAGMSGAGLVVGPYLVGVVVVHPARYGPNRLVVVPVIRLLANSAFTAELGGPVEAEPVGSRWRLEYATGRSVTMTPPYRPLPPGLDVAAARHQLLLPEYGVVPFGQREDLVATLADWCTESNAPALSVRTITGGGGSGKTRLAAQTCVRVAGAGFDAGFADVNTPVGVVRWLLDRPTLLVVDDADLNVKLIADLVTALAYSSVPARLLLVARARAPWWQSVQGRTGHLIDGFDNGDLPLAEHTLDLSARQHQYAAALAALTAKLPPPPRRAPTSGLPDLTAAAFADPLMVHLAALLSASGETLNTSTASSKSVRTHVLRAFLDREGTRWPRLFADQESSQISEGVLRRGVATATIAAPDDEASGAEILAAVPDLAGGEAGKRRAMTRWLHTLNPGPDYWNPLRPDPLVDRLLADLDVLPELALTLTEQAIQRADYATLDRMLAELTRAAAANAGAASSALSRVLGERLGDLLDAALNDPTGPLPQRLTAALTQQPASAPAAQLVQRLPKQSFALGELASTLGNQTVTYYRALTSEDPTSHRPRLAEALNNQSVWLLAIGQHESALAAATEACKIYFELAVARPDAFVSHLARALTNQSSAAAALGRREDALTAATLAVETYRELTAARPDDLHTELAMALNNQSNTFAALGQREQALAAITEAVDIRRRLADADADAFRPSLAMSLSNQSSALVNLGRREDALPAATEAVEIYRLLAEANPDAIRPELARSLNNQSDVLNAVKRWQDALTAGTEAVEIYRELAEARPAAFLPHLALALYNKSRALAGVDHRQEDMLAAATEAVEIFEDLASAHPGTFGPQLAMSLDSQSHAFAGLGRREDGLAAVQRSIDIYRELSATHPEAFRHELALALRNQSIVLAQFGRQTDSAVAATEAVAIYRGLVAVSPDSFRHQLARALHTQSGILLALPQWAAALTASTEAIEIFRIEANPVFRPELAMALRNQAAAFTHIGRYDEAQNAANEASALDPT